MINKIKALTTVFMNELLRELRLGYMKEKNFIGRYADIEIERRTWVNKTNCIIVGQVTENTSVRKIKQQKISYVNDTFIARWLGFIRNKIHYELAGWYQEAAGRMLRNIQRDAPAKIGGITLEGKKVT